MQTITHYEIYEAAGGQWSLAARFSGSEQQTAIAHARGIEDTKRRAVAVIEEIENLVNAQFDIRMIHRTLLGGTIIRPPDAHSDIGSRILMVILTGVALGALVTAVVGVLTSASAAGLGRGFFKMIMLGSFLMGAIIGSSLLFRLYIPVGLVLWNAKDPESRKRTIMTLAHGTVVAPMSDSGPNPSPDAPATEAPPASLSVSDFQSGSGSGSETSLPSQPSIAPPPAEAATVQAAVASPPPTAAPVQAAMDASVSALASLTARNQSFLEEFTDRAMAEVTAAIPMLMPPERQAISVYLAGAAQGVADRNVFDEVVTVTLIRSALERSGLTPDDVDVFLQELATEVERPKFRRMVEAGAAAIAERLDNPMATPSPTLTELLAAWNDPSSQAAGPQQITFLLTDIVGSTALTSQIGNAGAQRVVRAHNAICRAATKAFKGREVKHTGDGMLLVFPDPAAGARAAIDIQQEATAYALDNPTAPLVLRVGVHTGDAILEDGEYYGAAVAVVNGVTAVVDGGEICCSVAVRKKIEGGTFRFEDLGVRTVKGSPSGIEVAKLLWEFRRRTGPGVLEYRQIGTTLAGNQS